MLSHPSPNPPARVTALLALCGLLVYPGLLLGHDSPEHTVAALTARMAREGETADRLFQRATEFRVLGRLEQAAHDLQAALELDAQFIPAWLELCRLQHALGQTTEGLELAERALASLQLSDRQRAELQFVRAQMHEASGRPADALQACNEALQCARSPVDWYLVRSRLQLRLGQHEQRIKALHGAWEQSGSVVLRTAWIDALIDGQHWDRALTEIEPELESSRWQSSWLIRRGRVRLGQGEEQRGHRDLQRAIDEISQRINPARPDLTLLVDRALAFRLLGETELAAQDLAVAEAFGAEPWVLEPLNRSKQRIRRNRTEGN